MSSVVSFINFQLENDFRLTIIGRTLFYLCIAIYLYGDLAIYAAAVSKSLRDVACTYRPANVSLMANFTDESPCWENSLFTRIDAYRYVGLG
jgi:hypothetical protein